MVKIWEVEREWVKMRGNRVNMGGMRVKMEEKRIKMVGNGEEILAGGWGNNEGTNWEKMW